MKNLLIIVFVLSTLFSAAQGTGPVVSSPMGTPKTALIQKGWLVNDSGLVFPKLDTTRKPFYVGEVILRLADSTFYVSIDTTTGHQRWMKFRGYIPTGIGTGTVTSVASSFSNGTVLGVSGTPITRSGTLVYTWNGAGTDVVLGNGSYTPYSTLITGVTDPLYSPLGHGHVASDISDFTTAARNLFSQGAGISYNPLTGTISATLAGAIYNQTATKQNASFRINGSGTAKEIRTSKLLTDTLLESDFEIDVFPDIQNVTKSPRFQYGRSMFDWVKTNAVAQNIKAVLQVGDLTNEATQAEMDTAGAWFNKLDTAGVPYLAAIGNHDYVGINPAARNPTIYNNVFGASRMPGKSYFGGYFSNDPLNQEHANNWIKFDVGSRKYMVLNLELFPRDTVIAWASHILDSMYTAEPTRDVMVITHAYITNSNELARDTSVSSTIEYGMVDANDGQEMWDKLIKLKPNIKWVFNGHFIIAAAWAQTGLHGKIVSTGVNGNLINQIYVNYQDDLNWGDGYFMRLKFHPSSGTVDVSFFSSYYNANDIRVAGYTLADPTIAITTSIGINGNLAVYNDTRLQGKLKVENLTNRRGLFVGDDHQVKDTANFEFDPTKGGMRLKGLGLTPKPVLRMQLGDSAKYTAPFISATDERDTSLFQIRAFRVNVASNRFGSIFIGDRSGSNAQPTTGSLNGIQTTALGFRALENITTGYLNTAVGNMAMNKLTTGAFNNAWGDQSLFNLTTGSENTGAGQATLYNLTTGQHNTAIGNDALLNLVTGNYNVAIGKNAGLGVIGSSNIMIGYRVGESYATNIDNELWIHNSNDPLPLIWGNFVNRIFKINGKGQFTDTLTITTMGNADSSDRAASTAWVKRQGFGSGSGATPGIDDVLNVGQIFSTDHSINANVHNFIITNANSIQFAANGASGNSFIADNVLSRMYAPDQNSYFSAEGSIGLVLKNLNNQFRMRADSFAFFTTDQYLTIRTRNLPNKASLLSTDSLILKDNAGKWWVVNVNDLGISGATPTLDQVLTSGNVASHNININDGSQIILDADGTGNARITGGFSGTATVSMSSNGGANWSDLKFPSADRIYTFPNATGTIALTSDIPSTTNFLVNSNNLSDVSNTSTARINLGLAIGTNVQAYDADLTTYAGITPSANIQTFLGSANFSAARGNLGITGWADNLITTTNPSAIRYIKINADNTTSLQSASTQLSDLGGQASDGDLTAIAALTGTKGVLKKTATNTWELDTTLLGNLYYQTDHLYDSIVSTPNDTTLRFKSIRAIAGSTKIGITPTITDSTISYSIDVNEANLTLNNIGGTLGETKGGTGQTTYAQGDILYASAANTLSKLAKNTTATRYVSNTGTNNNPVWDQIDLTNGVKNTLPIANGGTGQTSYTDGQLLIGNTATGGLSKATITAGANITVTNGNGTITIASTGGGGGSTVYGIDTVLSKGDTLHATRSIYGGGFNLNIGTSGSKLSGGATNASGWWLFNTGIQLSSSSATDANYTISDYVPLVILPTITANRTLTFPSAGAGKKIEILNQNSSIFQWQASGVVDATGASIAAIPNGVRCVLINDGTNWVIGVDAPRSMSAIGDNTIKVYQALGSAIKAATIGVNYQNDVALTTFTLTDNRCQYIAVWLEQPTTITGVGFYQRTQGVYTADNTNQVGLYTYSGGTMTQVAASTNNGNLWKAASNTWVKEPFSATYYAQPGLYYIGFVYNSSAQTTAPVISAGRAVNASNEMTMDFTNSAGIGARKTGNSLPSTQTWATVDAADPSRPYVFIY